MSSCRRFAVFAFALAVSILVPAVASAATVDFRVFLNIDDDVATGCSISGMSGVDQILSTRVETSATAAQVVRTQRQVCAAGSFGAPIDVNTTGWAAQYNPASGQMQPETRISFAALNGGSMPVGMRLGFDGTNVGAVQTILLKPNGDEIIYTPLKGPKRRSVRTSQDRVIVLDGSVADWGGIHPIVEGTAGGGTQALRIIKIYAFANPLDDFLYFRFDAFVGGAAPFAADDSYTRNLGENLSVPAPGVLANDSPQPLTAMEVTDAEKGEVTLNADGSFTYQPDDVNSTESDFFEYQAADAANVLSNIARVTIDVSGVGPNQPPSFTPGPNVTVPANHGPYSQSWATNISPGPGESGQAVDFIVTNDNNALFHPSDQPAIAPDGTLTFTPAGNVLGTATVTVQLHDDGGTANGGDNTSDPVTFTITISCPSISVTNPATATGTAGAAFSQTFTQSGGIGAVTFTTASTLPAGLTLAANGTLSGTPTATGTFPIVVTVTDSLNCTGNSATYNLVIGCPTITVTNPATNSGTVGTAFSQTFTQSGAVGTATFTTSSTLPAGLTLAANGTLSGTPTQFGTFPIVVTVTDSNGCTGTGPTYTLTINCQTITVTNPATNTGTAGAAFSQTFTQSGANGTATFSTSSTLPAGLTLAANGVLSGTPTVTGTFPIVVTVTDSNGCTGTGSTYTLTIGCQTITVTNPATNTGTAGAAFSQTFTQSGAIGGATFSTASTLPAGLTLATNGTLSGTPTVTGTFPIVVTVTDGNGCTGTGATYNLTIGCQTITVTNPATNTGTAGAAFSQTFTQSGAIGTATFSTASTLPAGLTLAANGTLSGTPTVTGTFNIVVTVTDGNGCTGTGGTYTLTIGCQTITVTNPATNTGTVNAPFSQTFTQSGAIGGATFSTVSALPAGLTLAANGTLSGTPTVPGTFNIVVTVTDGNGCTGNGATYTLVIGCQTITVTNPATSTGTVNAAFSQTFTQSGAIGTATFTTSSTLPAGLSLATTGVLSGTPTVPGTFNITVLVTDSNGCTGTSAVYTLVIGCQTITVNNPATTTGTAGTAFSQNFTQSGGVGTLTFSTSSTLPAGLTLNSGTGALSGTPTVTGTFNIVVTVTDINGCTGTGATYTLVIGCQTITVNNPATTTGTAGTAFSQTFTQTGAIGTATFTTTSTLPAGLSLATNGTLSGTPTQTGTFNITVLVTDSNSCTGTSATYTLVIGCQVITVNNPATTTGTANAAFSQTFTQSGAIGTATFTTSSTLPAGLTLAANGVLSGTPTQTGTFNIVVTVTDSNNCTGNSATYTLVIGCQTITVNNPGITTGTVNAPFSQSFSQTGAIGTATFTTSSTLPAGLSLGTDGTLSGTPTEDGSFDIVVTVTDSNTCTGTSATYTLVIGCQSITVNNPATTSSPAGTPLSISFTQVGAVGTATFTTSSTLPAGLSLATDGTLSGTPTQGGPFPIVVLVTDSNGCTGTNGPYTLTITCPTISVTSPSNSTGTSGVAFSEQFTQSGGQLPIVWSVNGTLPTGISIDSGSGILSGTTNQAGVFSITVTATDANGCTGTSAQYDLTINCQTVTVTNPAGNSGTVDASFSEQFMVSGILGTVTWSVQGPTALPAGLTLNSSSGLLSGTPTEDGVFNLTIRATDTNGCFDDSAYTLTIACQNITVTNPVTNSGTVDAPFSAQFTQDSTHTPVSFTTTDTLPAGITLSTGGLLSGTPTEDGVFAITVTVTDVNGCTGASVGYTLTIACQTITVTNPGVNTGTVGAPFSQTFTQDSTHLPVTFSTSDPLPPGLTLSSTTGELSGTPTDDGVFPITVTVSDANGCPGTGSLYTLTIACHTITVTNPANGNGTVNASFSEQFNVTGIIGTATWSVIGTLPAGLSINSSTGELSGTPTEDGTFNVTVRATDSVGGCFGDSAYSITIACQNITVTNPGVTTGTAGTPFSQQFQQTGAVGTATFTTSSTLPPGLLLQADGTLSGTPTDDGTFNIDVLVTDSNGCTGTNTTYTLTIACQTITITDPTLNSIPAGSTLTPASDWTFTATPILGTATWTLDVTSGPLPTGITLSTAGVLQGSSTQQGSFPIVVRVTDTNGCFATKSYTLSVVCPTITVTRVGGGSFPAATFNVGYPAGNQVQATGQTGTVHWSYQTGTQPPGINLTIVSGTFSGIPSATGNFSMTVVATDQSTGCTGSATFPFTINPRVQANTYSNLVDNTQAFVTGGTTATPATPAVQLSGTLLANDTPSGNVTITTLGNFATTAGGTVNIAADGTFLYTPPLNAGAAAITSDTFTYTGSSNTGAVPSIPQFAPSTGASSATATVTLNLLNRVWYVNNSAGVNGNGQSHSPFNTTAGFASGARVTPDVAGDIIYIYNGTNTTANQNTGIALLANEQLIGEGVALVVNSNTLVAAGTKPLITNIAGNAVTLNNGNTVKGLNVTGPTGNGVAGTNTAGLTMDTMTIQGAGAASSGLVLNGSTGTIALTDVDISNSPFGLTIDGGTSAITFDTTSTINAGAGQRSIQLQNRTGGSVAIGAAVTDNGTGLQAVNNSGGTVDFTNTQTFNTGNNTAVFLTTNTGSTFTFSGTLAITTGTGNGFVANFGGTLNVGVNSSITTGAAIGLWLDGITVGGSGVILNTLNTTNATTAINLINVNGTVTSNGGTITNGTTGIHLQGASTNLQVTGLTITGATTGITNTTNFGTLTVTNTDNVSAATALNLTGGTVNGTFGNVSSTGGTNGVSLTNIAGIFGSTSGTLTGATAATFNVSGGTADITWGGNITQSNGANVVTIANKNSGSIDINGNVTSNTASTGLSISGGTGGSYTFDGTNVFSGAGGITIGPSQAGTIAFSANTTNTTTGTPFNVAGGGGAVTAAITYLGTINKNSAGALITVDNLDTPGTLTMTRGTQAAGDLTLNNNGATGISVINSSSTNITISNASVTYNNVAAGFTASGNSGTINLPGLFLDGNGNKAGMLISGGGTINVNGGAANPTIDLSGGSAAAARAIDGTTASFTGTLNLTNAAITGNASADTVTLTGSTLGGTGSTISGPRALILSGVALTSGAGMTSITSAAGANGISLTNVTGGTYTVAGGSLSGHSNTAFNVSGGSATFSYGGTVTQNTAGQRVVNIDGPTSGTISLTNTVTGGAGSSGVNINNTNGNVTFTTLNLGSDPGAGGARITSQAVTINGGTGTYGLGTATIWAGNVSGIAATNANGTLNITGGLVDNQAATAISIDGPAGLTTLGITLTRVSSNGGTSNGITIIDTDGTFTVNGDGTNTALGGNNSGGTITGKSGADGSTTSGSGVFLSNATNITLRRMRINGTNQNFGIGGSNVSNFTLEYSTVTGTNGNSAALDESAVGFDNLTGAAAITSCVLEGGFEDNLNVVNTSGTLNRLVVSSSTFGFNSTANGNNNITLEAQGAAATLNYTIKGSLIRGARADWLNAQPAAGGTMHGIIGGDLVADGNTFSNLAPNNHPGVVANGNRVLLQANGSYTLIIKNNTLNGSLGSALATNSLSSTASMTITMEGNTIGTAATANSGSTSGSGISIQSTNGGDVNIRIHNNQVRQYNNHGILLTYGDIAGTPPTISTTVSSNTVNTPGNLLTNFNGFHLNNGTVAGESFTTCLNIFDNNFSNSGSGAVSPNNDDVRLRQRQDTTVQLPGYTGPVRDNGDNVVAEVITYLRPAGSGGLKNNTFITGTANSVSTGGGFVNSPSGNACATP